MDFVLKKFVKNKRNILVIGIIIIVFSIIFVFNKMNNFLYKSTIDTMNFQIQMLNSEIPRNSDDKDPHFVLAKATLVRFEKEKAALEKKDFNAYNELLHQTDLESLEQIKTNPGSTTVNLKDTEESIAYYEAVKKSGQDFGVMRGVTDAAFGNTFVNLSAWEGWVVTLVLLAILCGDFLGNEFPEQIRFYGFLAEKRRKVHFRYFLTPVIVAFSILIALFLVFFVITGLTKGWGSVFYPYGLGDYILTPVYQIELWALLYLVLIIIFISSLGQLLSVIVKKPYVGSSLLVILLVAYSMIVGQDFMKPFIKWIPFSYLGSGEVLNRSSLLFGNVSLPIGVAYLLICSIIFYFLSNFIFSKYIYRRV